MNGSRVLGEFQRESMLRHVGVHFFSWLVTIIAGSRITDVSNGYRAIRTDKLKGLVGPGSVLGVRAADRGDAPAAADREVPITIRARAGGVSKKPKNIKYAWHFSKAIGKTWLR